jgi:hypothetical protein
MTKPAPTGPGPGERQPKETAVAFEAFRCYLEMGPSRSVAKVGQALGKSKTLIDRWSSRWGWVERVRQVESRDAALVDESRATELAKHAQRQARQAQVHAAASTLVAQELLERVATARKAGKDPFVDVATADLIRFQTSAARSHNRAVVTERLALGMTTDQPGEAVPRERAQEMAARLTPEELDQRLGVVDELAPRRDRRRQETTREEDTA